MEACYSLALNWPKFYRLAVKAVSMMRPSNMHTLSLYHSSFFNEWAELFFFSYVHCHFDELID